MTRRILFVLTALASFWGWGWAAAAQETPGTRQTVAARENERAEWIKQLDADRYNDRQEASEKLAAAGAEAIPALVEAAQTGAPEAAARAVNILGDHLSKGNGDLKAAAKAALETVAQGANPVAARRAKSALEESQKPPPEPVARQLPLRIFGGGIQGGIQIRGGGQIQIQVAQNNGVQIKRVSVSNNNGVKQVEAEEGGRKVKIKDDPNNGIEMEVTETKDGKETTQKYQAKNAEELKKNHPDAHKIYEQYNHQAQVQVAPATNAVRRSAEIRIDSLQRSIETLQRTLELMENQLGRDKAKEIKQHLENVKRELSEAKKKLADEPAVQPAQQRAEAPPADNQPAEGAAPKE